MNMFAKNDAKSLAEYLANIPDQDKITVDFIHNFIQKSVPNLEPYFATNMIGYGSFYYLDSKNTKKEWPIISLANQKNYISIYICAILDAESKKDIPIPKLGKLTKSIGCVRFKSIEDIDLNTLEKLLKWADKNPGLSSARMVYD